MKVISTGGLGRMIAKETDFIDIYDADLTFKGLKIIYDKTKKNLYEKKNKNDSNYIYKKKKYHSCSGSFKIKYIFHNNSLLNYYSFFLLEYYLLIIFST